MKIYDVSVAITSDMPVYPGDPAVDVEQTQQIAKGDAANVTRLALGAHTGTHVDAPSHFVEGAMTVDQIPINLLVGRARVVEISSAIISAEVLKEFDFTADARLLFKTRNSYLWGDKTFNTEFVYITKDAAERLVADGIKVVGIDYLSVEKYDSPSPDVHRTLLGNGTIIIEGLDLRDVEPGDYEMICLPMKIEGGDGAPARVVLRG
jgi:arylformamidase